MKRTVSLAKVNTVLLMLIIGINLYIIAAIIFYPVYFKFKERLSISCAYLSPLVAYFVVLKFVLPYIHLCVRGQQIVALEKNPYFQNLSAITWNGIATNFPFGTMIFYR